MDFPSSPQFSLQKEFSAKEVGKDSPAEWTSEAMMHSSLAANFMRQHQYAPALVAYEQALVTYRRDAQGCTIVEKCNAAATLHNMGLLHKRCKRYNQAIACLEEAEVLYRESSTHTKPRATGEGVCLEYLLAETLQNRANLYSKYSRDVPAAIDCHEEVVTMLLDLGYSPLSEVDQPDDPPAFNGEANKCFVRITDDQKVHLLSISLRSLGNLYLQQGEQEDALGAYQEALDMLRARQSKFPTLNLRKKIASILLSMACVYFSQNQLDQAVAALDECISNHDGDHTHPDVLTALSNLGLAYEHKGDLEKAILCYDDLIELKRRQFGEKHIDVADALVTAAKTLERQGNISIALERYQEALEVYHCVLSQEDPSFALTLAEVLSQISFLSDDSLSRDRQSIDHVVNVYRKALPPKTSTTHANLDEANVFFQLAKLYKDKKSYEASLSCLAEVRQILLPFSRDDERVRKLGSNVAILESSLQVLRQPEQVSKGDKLLRGNPSLLLRSNPSLEGKGRSKGVHQHLVDDPPILPIPSSKSLNSEIGGEDDDQGHSIPIHLDLDMVEHQAGMACLVVQKSRSNLSRSDATRSVTPESSLEELVSPSTKMNASINSGHETSTVPEMTLHSLRQEFSAMSDTSVSSEKVVAVHLSAPELPLREEYCSDEESEEFSLPLLTPVPSEAVESSIGLNAYSEDASSCPLSPDSSHLRMGQHEFQITAEDAIHEQQPCRRSSAKLGLVMYSKSIFEDDAEHSDCDDESDTEQNDNGSGDEIDLRSPAYSQSEYDSFGEGSVCESENNGNDHLSSDFERSDIDETHIDETDIDVEETDFEYETEDEELASREDIYWDEEENREVILNESQVSDDDEVDYIFQTPLGLEAWPKEKFILGEATMVTTQIPESPEDVAIQRHPSPQRAYHASFHLSPKKSPGSRFAKALVRPFRKKSTEFPFSKLEPTPEDDLADLEDSPFQKHFDFKKVGLDDDISSVDPGSFTGPIQFVKLDGIAVDDVSQITVRRDDFLSREGGTDNRWGWIPTVFADIAEEFLSAKSIHNKSRGGHKGGTFGSSSSHDSDPFDDLSEKEQEAENAATDTKCTKNVDVNLNIGQQKSIQSRSVTGSHTKSETSNTRDESGTTQSADNEVFYLPPLASGPNVEGIVSEVNSTLWKPTSKMPSLNSMLRQSSPRIQSRIHSLSKNMDIQKDKYGYFSEEVAESLIAIALLRVECGETDDAVESLVEALKIQKFLRNPNAMAKSLHVLADIYCRQEEFNLALACYNDVKRIERRLYGPDHPENANTLNKIGRVFASQGMFYQAMEKHQQALQVLKGCVGEDLSHPAVSQTLIHIGEVYYRERNSLSTIRNNADDYKRFIETGMLDIIARAHEDKGSYKMALGFMEEKLQLIKNENTEFPEDQLAQILFKIGNLSCKSGVFLEAIDYYEQALEIQIRLGCTDVEIATAKVLIGTVDYHVGQYRKALNLLESALIVFKKEFGEEHEAVADTLHRIALVKSALWQYDDALKILVHALKLQLKLFGESDLEVLKTKLEICWIEMNKTLSSEVASHIKAIMRKQQDMVGESHPIIADTLLLLGKVYLLRGSNSKAIKALQESFSMRERFLGRDHPVQAETYYLIAVEVIRREKYHQALTMCNSVLGIRRETLGERHVDVASTLASLGRCYVGGGKLSKAMACFNEALQIARESVGENHPCIGDIHVGNGIVYLRKCQFDVAKESVEKGLRIYETGGVHGDHPSIREATALLERVERDEMLCV